MIKQFIRQWLCEHKSSIWVNTKTHTFETIEHPKPQTTWIETTMMCESCKKFYKINTGELLTQK